MLPAALAHEVEYCWQARLKLHHEWRKLADEVMMAEDRLEGKPLQVNGVQLAAVFGQMRQVTEKLRASFETVSNLQLERLSHSADQVKAEQRKLETHRRLYPTMQRQLASLEVNVQDWERMMRTCTDDNKKLAHAMSALVQTLSAAPKWVFEAFFDTTLQRTVRELPTVIRTESLSKGSRNRLLQLLGLVARCPLWSTTDVLDVAKRAVASEGNSAKGHDLKAVEAKLRAVDLSINGRVSIWWNDDKCAYDGVLVKPNCFSSTGLLQVNYDDGDVRKYSLEQLVLRSQRALPLAEFLTAALRRAEINSSIGGTVKVLSWSLLKVIEAKLEAPAMLSDRKKPKVVVVQTTGNKTECSIPALVRLVKAAELHEKFVHRLKSCGAAIGRECKLSIDGRIRSGKITLVRQQVETQGNLTVVFNDNSKQHLSINDLAARITAAEVQGHVASVASGVSSAAAAAPSAISLQPFSFPHSDASTTSKPASTPEAPGSSASAALNEQLRLVGIPAHLGDEVNVWPGDHARATAGKLVAAPDGSGCVSVVAPGGKLVVTCTPKRLKHLLTVARRYDQDLELFRTEYVKGFIEPGRTVQLFSPTHNRVVHAMLATSRYEASGCKFSLRFMDGTTTMLSAPQVLENVVSAAGQLVDRGLAAHQITEVSATAHSKITIWGGPRGLVSGTLHAGFTPQGAPQVALLEDGAMNFICQVDELTARYKQAKKIEAVRHALRQRGLRLGGPIDVWWGGDKRAYRGTLQVESNFDTSGKLTVRYDDGDIRHYDPTTLMVSER